MYSDQPVAGRFRSVLNSLSLSHNQSHSQSQASQAIPAGTVASSIAGRRVTAARSAPPDPDPWMRLCVLPSPPRISGDPEGPARCCCLPARMWRARQIFAYPTAYSPVTGGSHARAGSGRGYLFGWCGLAARLVVFCTALHLEVPCWRRECSPWPLLVAAARRRPRPAGTGTTQRVAPRRAVDAYRVAVLACV
jgi:hypothetical protein